MTKIWRQILKRLEAKHEREETHPLITRVSRQEADEKRNIQAVGQEGVTCDLPCYGNDIPQEYSHTSGEVNVFSKDISVKGWENSQEGEGESYYSGIICGLTSRKICVVRDETLRRAIER